MDAVSIGGGDSKMSAADNSKAYSTNIRGRRGGISSNNNTIYGDATKSNDNRPPSNRGRSRGRSGGMSLNNSMYGDERLGVGASSRTSLSPTRNMRSRKNRGAGLGVGNENDLTINSPDPKKKKARTKSPFGISGALFTEGSSTSKTAGKKRNDLEVDDKVGNVAKSIGKKRYSEKDGEWLPEPKKKATRGKADKVPPKKARRTKVNVEIKKKGSGGGKAKKGERESRSGVAQKVGTVEFSMEESEKIVTSGLSDSATQEVVQSGIEHCEKIIKFHRSNGNSQELIKEVELKKSQLLRTLILVLGKNQPKDEDKVRARVLVRKRFSRLKPEEQKLVEDVREFNTSIVNAFCSLTKSIRAIGGDTQEGSDLGQAYDGLIDIVYQATKADIGTEPSSSFHLVELMKEWFIKSDLIAECNRLMGARHPSRNQVLAVLQKKMALIEEALDSISVHKPMCQSVYQSRWNDLEEEEARIVSSFVCEEGLFVDAGGNEVDANTKNATQLIPEEGRIALNIMKGVQKGQNTMIEKHWAPPLENMMTRLLDMLLDEEQPPPLLPYDIHNGCLTAYSNLATSVVHSEAGGQVTQEFINQVNKNIFFSDEIDVYALSKTYPQLQFEKFEEMMSITRTQNLLRSKVRTMSQVTSNMLEGLQSRLATASKESFDESWHFIGAGITRRGDAITGPTQHGETMCTPEIKMSMSTISPSALIAQSLGLAILYSGTNLYVSAYSQSMAIISDRANEKISPDAWALIKRSMFIQRSKNSKKGWEKRQEAEDYLNEDGKVDSQVRGWEKRRKAKDYLDGDGKVASQKQAAENNSYITDQSEAGKAKRDTAAKKAGDSKRAGNVRQRDGKWEAQIRFPGTCQFSLGSSYDSKAIARRACDAANKVIKTKSATELKSDVESMKKVCRDAAEEETGFPSAKPRKVVDHAKVVITTEDGRKLGGFTNCPKASEACGEDKTAVKAALKSKTGRVRKTNFFARLGTPVDSVGLSELGKQLLYCDENGAPTKKKKLAKPATSHRRYLVHLP